MPYMTRIPSDLARFGLRVELVPGWETRGSSSFAPACVVNHWTAGPRGTTGRPSLNVVTYGRTDLAGPLCNVYLDRRGTCVVVAAGRASHAGEGGFRGLVGNSAAYGIEAESGGDGDWTPEMLDAYPRLNAALLSGLGRDGSWVASHSEWAPTRKIDIRDVIGSVRAKTVALLANPAPAASTGDDDEMDAWNAAVLAETLDRVKGITFPKPGVADAASKYMPRDSLRIEAVAAAIPRLEAQVAGLSTAMQGLAEALVKQAGGDDVDTDELVRRIGERVDAAVSDAAKLVKVEVSVNDQNAA